VCMLCGVGVWLVVGCCGVVLWVCLVVCVGWWDVGLLWVMVGV
jgi:hypothetical protein